MKTAVVFLVILGVAFAAEKTATNPKYANIDVDRILNNERLSRNYIKCLLDEGNCTNEGRELKRRLPEALETGCKTCTAEEKETSKKVITKLQTRKEWPKLLNKYDPDGKFLKRHEAELRQKQTKSA